MCCLHVSSGVEMQVIVYHDGYGCDTGCCGHRIEIDGKPQGFYFAHPYIPNEDFKVWATELVRDTCGDECANNLDWENCVICPD